VADLGAHTKKRRNRERSKRDTSTVISILVETILLSRDGSEKRLTQVAGAREHMAHPNIKHKGTAWVGRGKPGREEDVASRIRVISTSSNRNARKGRLHTRKPNTACKFSEQTGQAIMRLFSSMPCVC
jgi:hypothetical protein